MQGTIDRFEEEFAVVELESGKMKNIKRSLIPKDAKEGDVLNIEGDVITIDYEETEKRRKEIEEMTKDLFE